MSFRPEQPPAILPHRPFPTGDAVGAPFQRAATKLAELLGIESDQEIRARLRWMRDISYQSWAAQKGQTANAVAIQSLTDNWDQEQLSNNEIPLKGHFVRAFQTSIGFLASTNFLPLDFKDYTGTIEEMKELPLTELATLVGEAEHSMRSHKRINEILPRLAKLQAAMNGVSSKDNTELLAIKYGTYLPYILSSISRLETYLPTHLSDQQLARFIDQSRRELGMD